MLTSARPEKKKCLSVSKARLLTTPVGYNKAMLKVTITIQTVLSFILAFSLVFETVRTK
jgi:hypothetical protein